MFEFREIKSETEYKPLELNPDAPFTQAWFFGEWQEAMNRKVRRFGIKQGEEIVGFFQVIKYPAPFSQNILYIPHGPVLTYNTNNAQHTAHINEFLKEFHKKLTQLSKEENAVLARFDFYFHNFNYESKKNMDRYFKKTPAYAYHSSYFQPKFEWILDLNKTEEELLGGMHPKTRYNIRLAEKRGIRIEVMRQNFEKYFNDFYRFLEETAKRDNFNLHPKTYYRNIFKTINSENAFLAVAEYENKFLLVNLILMFGKTAYFMHGGSSDEHKNLMFSYLAQWEAIKEAKKRGFKIYNFGAVGLNDGAFGGISRFKKGFGGRLLEYSDSYDLVQKPFWYYLYNLRKIVLRH